MRVLFLLSFLLLFMLQANAQEDIVCKDPALLKTLDHYIQHPVRTNSFTANYDLKYHRLEWTIDPAVRYIAGNVTTYFVPSEDNFSTINFDLDEALEVTQVWYHGTPTSFQHFQSEDRLSITLPQPIVVGQLDSLSILYEGVPTTSGFGSFRSTIHGFDSVGVISTLSEPYGSKDWWPCKLDLDDKIDSIDVIVRTPQEYRAASNGLLVNEWQDGTDKLYHWQHRYPITTYLIAIGVTNYGIYSDTVALSNGQEVEILNYLYPELQTAIANALTPTSQAMVLFDSLFGTYPFVNEKYGHAQFDFGGGMEHQTMSFMGAWSFGLQAHELAHQWFGDKITCGSWQDIWLNEGFATYLTGLCYENNLGFYNWYNWKRDRITLITAQSGGSVFVPDTSSHVRIFDSRLTYNKGSMLLHMLRWKLGDEVFFQAVYDYINDPDLAYSYAKTEDLKAHLEGQSGQNLDEFFADWFFGEGYPSYLVTWWPGNPEVRIRLEQSTSHPSVDFYEMPVPLLFRSADGQEEMRVFDHTFSGEEFMADLPFEVTEVIFDPDLWIVSKDNEVQFGPTSAEDLEALGAKIHLFPNPVGDNLNVDLTELEIEVQQMELWNEAGQLLRHYPVRTGNMQISTSQLPGGQYILKLRTKNGLISKSFLKS